MTLIVTVLSDAAAYVFSDTRISYQDKLPEDLIKATIVETPHSRFSVTYTTPIAKIGTFQIADWIKDAICKTYQSEKETYNFLLKLEGFLTAEFKNIPLIKSFGQFYDTRLQIVISGFDDDGRVFYAELSNATDSNTGFWLEKPNLDFKLNVFSKLSANPTERISWNGYIFASTAKYFEGVRNLINKQPEVALVGKIVDIFRSIADDHDSKNTIGKDVLVTKIPLSFTDECSSRFYPYLKSESIKSFDFISLKNLEDIVQIKGIEYKVDGEFIFDAKTPKRNPCPCGSGKRYKNCHGKNGLH